MPTSLTFTTLTTQLQAYMERGGSVTTDPTVTAQLPYAINGAERKLMQMLKLQGEIEILSDPTGLAIGLPVIAKPDRWRQTVSLNYGAGTGSNTRTPILPRAYEYCRSYWPDDTQTAAPLFYADYDLTHWLIAPTPDASYPLEIVAYLQPALLDASTQSNFFTIYTPNALLYGALLEMTPFLKNDERIPVWEKYWQMELQSLMGQDLQKIFDRAAERKTA